MFSVIRGGWEKGSCRGNLAFFEMGNATTFFFGRLSDESLLVAINFTNISEMVA